MEYFRFDIKLLCHSKATVAIQISLHLSKGCAYLNSYENSTWGKAQNGGALPIRGAGKFEIILTCEFSQYKVAINGQHYCTFPQRIHYDRITHLAIEGDVSIAQISYRDGFSGSSPSTVGFSPSPYEAPKDQKSAPKASPYPEAAGPNALFGLSIEATPQSSIGFSTTSPVPPAPANGIAYSTTVPYPIGDPSHPLGTQQHSAPDTPPPYPGDVPYLTETPYPKISQPYPMGTFGSDAPVPSAIGFDRPSIGFSAAPHEESIPRESAPYSSSSRRPQERAPYSPADAPYPSNSRFSFEAPVSHQSAPYPPAVSSASCPYPVANSQERSTYSSTSPNLPEPVRNQRGSGPYPASSSGHAPYPTSNSRGNAPYPATSSGCPYLSSPPERAPYPPTSATPPYPLSDSRETPPYPPAPASVPHADPPSPRSRPHRLVDPQDIVRYSSTFSSPLSSRRIHSPQSLPKNPPYPKSSPRSPPSTSPPPYPSTDFDHPPAVPLIGEYPIMSTTPIPDESSWSKAFGKCFQKRLLLWITLGFALVVILVLVMATVH